MPLYMMLTAVVIFHFLFIHVFEIIDVYSTAQPVRDLLHKAVVTGFFPFFPPGAFFPPVQKHGGGGVIV